MYSDRDKTIMHIDANSAFLSWQAAYEKQIGADRDLRNLPAIIGGSQKSRHGIVLAKSIMAKKAGIKTGESIMEARTKCKDLIIVPPNYNLYIKCSKALISLLREYSPNISVFSIDECFLDYTAMEEHFGPPVAAAHKMKERIHKELGFTVNIGISTNKLLAKQAGDLSKPDKVHTIYPDEIKEKLWPLPVEELFMVGTKTKPKLNEIGIYTIGDLANSDYKLISNKLKSHGRLIYQYAWGIDYSNIDWQQHSPFKSIGNGTTVAFDVEDNEMAYTILLSLVETVSKRLRQGEVKCNVVAVSLTSSEFVYRTHQRKLLSPTDSTYEIYHVTKQLFDEMWDGLPIRKLNVRASELVNNLVTQLTLFDKKNKLKLEKMDRAVDTIREKYGDYSIMRGVFVHSGLKPMIGGYEVEDYPGMSSIL